MINRVHFYTQFKELIKPRFTTKQFEGFEAIFNEWDLRGLTDLRWLAYMLATAWHETANTMQPIEEFGKGKGKDYGKKLKMSRKPYTFPDKIYYGRGLVQLTWYENYDKMGKLLGFDFLRNPELLLVSFISIKVMFEGMLKGKSNFGDFTGKSLEQYFNEKDCDPIGARKIINGTDRDKKIAGEYYLFLRCLKTLKK